MLRSKNEEWERRKWYLVRNLFDNEPLLSPIPETQEQSLDLRSPTEAAVGRPYSPLPDLIIEKEPNRHDEPEEYYQDLEKKIKKIYRRLFLKTRTSEDTSTEDNDEFVFRANIATKAIEETIQFEHSSIGRRQSSEKSCSQEETEISDEQISESTNSSSNDRPRTRESTDSSSVQHSRRNEPACTSSIEQPVIDESTNSSNEHSGVNSNSSVESSTSIENNEESMVFEKTKSTRSSIEESDRSSMSVSHHQIIVTQAQIHDTGINQQAETASHMEPDSPLDKRRSKEEYLPNILSYEIIATQAEIHDTGSNQLPETHMVPASPLDKRICEEDCLQSMSRHEIIVAQTKVHDGNFSKQLADTTMHIEPCSPLGKVTEDDDPVISGSEKEDQSKSTVIIVRLTNTEVGEAQHEQSECELESYHSSNSREEINGFALGPGVHSGVSSLDEPEVMRRRDKSNINQSANSLNSRTCSSTGIVFQKLELSAIEMEEAEESADFSLISGASTPRFKSQDRKYSKRGILSEISSSCGLSKRRKQNLATQTSFSSSTDDENNWEEIRTHFFEGNPCIYKLCTCSNHVCC